MAGNLKPVTVYVTKDFAVPSVYTTDPIGTHVDDIQDALWIGAQVQSIVRAYHSDSAITQLQEDYERRLADVKRVSAERIQTIESEKRELEARIRQTRQDVGSEFDQQLRTMEERRRALEESRQSDIEHARMLERTAMERILAEKEREITRLDGVMTAMRTLIERQTDEVRALGARLNRGAVNVKLKGSLFEQDFRTHLIQAYGIIIRDFSIKDTARGAGHEGDFITTLEGEQIMWELKDYSSDVPKKEVDKFLRDMRDCHGARIGVMISRATGILGKHGNITMDVTDDGRLLIFIGNYESWPNGDDGPGNLFHILLQLFRLWWATKRGNDSEDSDGEGEGDGLRKRIEEHLLLLQSYMEDLKTRRTEWRTHKGRMEETIRWVAGLLDDSQMKFERLIRSLRDDSGESGVPAVGGAGSDTKVGAILKENDGHPKYTEWANEIYSVCSVDTNGFIELQELEQIIARKRQMSKETVRSHLLRILREDCIEKRGAKKIIRGIRLHI
jgi:hypothetical protein